MDNDLAFRESRVTWRGVVMLGAAGAIVYTAITLFGSVIVGLVAAVTVGYLLGKTNIF